MAEQPPQQQQQTDKESLSSSAKITTTPGKGDKAQKRKLFTSVTPEDEKKTPKVTPKRKKTTSQPGSPTLLGTPGRSIPLSERQQLALLMQMTAEESPAQGLPKDSPGAKPIGVKSKVNNQNNRGETSLHISAIKGDVQLAESLISQGADVNARDFAGWTALHEACNHGHPELTKLLLSAGAFVNALGSDDDTPLHDAAANGHREVVEILLERGASPMIYNKAGNTPLDLASDPDIRKLMLNVLMVSGKDASVSELPGPTYPDHVAFDERGLVTDKKREDTSKEKATEAIKPLISLEPSTEDPYEFTQDNSNEQKITIHWMSPDKTAVGGSSCMEITRTIPKAREQSTPVSFSSTSTSDSDLLDPQLQQMMTKPLEDIKGDVGRVAAPLAVLPAKQDNVIQKELPSTVKPESDTDQPLFIDEDVNLVEQEPPKEAIGEMPVKANEVKEAGLRQGSESLVEREAALLQKGLVGSLEGGVGVKYTIPKPNVPEMIPEPIEESNLKLTIMRLSQDKDLVCEPGEKKGVASKRSSPVTIATTPTNSEPILQKVGVKRAPVCDPVTQVDDKKRRESPTSQLRLVVSTQQDQGSSSDSTDSKRAWRILHPPQEMATDITAEPDVELSLEKPALAQEKQQQPASKEKTKKHRDRSQKSHKKHKHSHALKEEVPEVPVEVPQAAPPVVTPLFEALKEAPTGSPPKKPEESDSKDPTARAYYIVKQKQSSSGEIKKLLLRTSAPGLVSSSNEEKKLDGKIPEPDSTEVVDATALLAPDVTGVPQKVQGPVEGVNSGSSRGSPTVTSSDQVVMETTETKESKDQEKSIEKTEKIIEGIKSELISADGKPPPKVTRTLRSNSNLQTITSQNVEEERREKEMNVSQPMTRSRRNQLEAAASANPLGQDQGMDSHPRKRKIAKHRQQQQEELQVPVPTPQVPLHEQANSMEQFLNIRREMRKRQRANILPVVPNMPNRYDEYLMNRKTYLLQGDPESKINRAVPKMSPPVDLNPALRENYDAQENKRHSLRLRHQIEREKLMLAAEQEVLRVYGRGARAMANQTVPFSACMILNDMEVYNMPDPMSQEDSKGNSRQRYNGRHFHSWLHDVDEKYEKIKEDLLKRHQHEAMSLYAIQKLEWELKLQELKMWDSKKPPNVSKHVPMVEIDRDFDLLPKS